MKARLLEIVPVAVYLGEVYTQDAVLELPDGTRIRVDDTHKLCDESLLGSTVSIRISATDVREAEAAVEETYELITDAETPSVERLAGMVAEVIEAIETRSVLDVDFGSGSVCSTMFREDTPGFTPTPGDFVVFERILGVYLEEVTPVED